MARFTGPPDVAFRFSPVGLSHVSYQVKCKNNDMVRRVACATWTGYGIVPVTVRTDTTFGEPSRVPTGRDSKADLTIAFGGEHGGPGIASNVIVLCPNHHALCDMCAAPLHRADIRSVEGLGIPDASPDPEQHGRPPPSPPGAASSRNPRLGLALRGAEGTYGPAIVVSGTYPQRHAGGCVCSWAARV